MKRIYFFIKLIVLITFSIKLQAESINKDSLSDFIRMNYPYYYEGVPNIIGEVDSIKHGHGVGLIQSDDDTFCTGTIAEYPNVILTCGHIFEDCNEGKKFYFHPGYNHHKGPSKEDGIPLRRIILYKDYLSMAKTNPVSSSNQDIACAITYHDCIFNNDNLNILFKPNEENKLKKLLSDFSKAFYAGYMKVSTLPGNIDRDKNRSLFLIRKTEIFNLIYLRMPFQDNILKMTTLVRNLKPEVGNYKIPVLGGGFSGAPLFVQETELAHEWKIGGVYLGSSDPKDFKDFCLDQINGVPREDQDSFRIEHKIHLINKNFHSNIWENVERILREP